MISFLIKKDYLELKREYVLRYWTATFFFLALTMVTFFGFLFATHIKVTISKNIIEGKISETESEAIYEQRKKLEEEVKKLSKKVSALDSDIVYPSIFVEEVFDSAPSGVHISDVSVDVNFIDLSNKSENDLIKIAIKGDSDTRDNLSKFHDNLLESVVFSEINIPYSNFAKISDIQFTAELISSKKIIEKENEKN